VSTKSALTQPLVSRPAYGRGGTVAESGLPGGGPADKGQPLDSDIPGTKTFVKPLDDERDADKPTDTSIFRRDNADDLQKSPGQGETREHVDPGESIGMMGLGKPDPKDQSKTKYPYRDGIPNQKNASAAFVVGMYQLQQAHTLRVNPTTRTASVPDEILAGLNPKFQARADKCSVSTKRVDVPNLRWIFSVDCGNGPKVVKLKSFRPTNVTKISKMDMDLKCSCPAWRWLGPEHHAKQEEYLDGKPRGTASVPFVRDPTGINRVCKHVAAVLGFTQAWTIPRPKKRAK